MTKRITILVLTAMGGIVLGQTASLGAAAVPLELPYRPDRLLIKPKAGHGPAALANFHAARRLEVLRRFPAFEDLQVVRLPAGATVSDLVTQYQQSGLVDFAEPDYWVRATATSPNDPRFADGTQWSLNNTGQNGGTADADIDAPESWDTVNSASNIIVAVIDSGVRYTHEDLAANIWTNPGEIPGNGIDDDRNGFIDDVYGINAIDGAARPGDPNDDFGHGTHVAGILGAVGNNSKGLAGVAWRVKIMALKFLDSTGNGSIADAVQCVDYARAKGAKVINASFGGTNYSSALYTAIYNARSAGVIFVAAAGNSSDNNDTTAFYPCGYALDNLIAVAATDRSDALADYSNYGATTVDVAAPGSTIYSTYYTADDAYLYLSGTSMAAPHVSGLCALMRARFTLENYRQIIERIYEAADRLPSLSGKCATGGRINMARALIHYQIAATNYAWIVTNGFKVLALTDNGVSGELPLPFTFNFFGRNCAQLFVGANGLLSFTNAGLSATANTALANPAAPNGAMYPFWDDLNPDAGGKICYGTNGSAPNRRFVVTWAGVPRKNNNQVTLTFQAALEETSQRMLFQYQQVQPNSWFKGGGGSMATVGIENFEGTRSAEFLTDGVPYSLTNNQALVFIPVLTDAMEVGPADGLNALGFAGGSFTPSNQVYTISNAGSAPLNWAVSRTRNWTSLSATNGTLPIGQATNIAVTINDNARALSAGTYLDTVSFSNATSGAGSTTRSVEVVVRGTNAMLQVSPVPGLSAAGFTGGPFSPLNQVYTLINPGDAEAQWAATATTDWVTLSTTNGTLAAGASVTVTISINPNAESLPAGAHTDAVQFRNLSNGNGNTTRPVTLQVNVRPGILTIIPESGFTTLGIAGSPFTPDMQDYLLTNSGAGPLTWVASHAQPWLLLSATNGALEPGQSATVRLTLNAAALAPGAYFDTVDFVNTTSGAGNNSRVVSLTVQPPPGVLAVAPAEALSVTGWTGGPFAFTNHVFTLSNTGGSNLLWVVSQAQDWLDCSATEGLLMPGETTNITVTLGANASALADGAHTNQLGFTNLTDNRGNASRDVVLWLVPPPGCLTVTPLPGLSVTGVAGGPFASPDAFLVLSNAGGSNLLWAASPAEDWLECAVSGGELAPGETTNLLLSVHPKAGLFPPGTYTNLIGLTNLTSDAGSTVREFVLVVYPPPGVLEVTPPDNLSVTGWAGGPFAFTNHLFTLSNTGGSNLLWAVSQAQDWLDFSAAAGLLIPGESTNILVALGANAPSLAAGRYTNQVSFTNLTAGVGAVDFDWVLLVRPRPVLQPAATGFVDGQFQLILTGEPGQTLVLEVSTNLQGWTPFLTNTVPLNGPLEVTDPEPAPTPRRYYRSFVP